MPFNARRIVDKSWSTLGVGADLYGRVGFLTWMAFAIAGIFTVLQGFVGAVSAIIVAFCAVGALVGLWLTILAVRREAQRQELAMVSGTLIPPGYAAIVTGEQAEAGEWVPPGLTVTMGPGTAADDLGNTASGANSRIYGGTGNTAMSAGAIIGRKLY